MIATDRVISTPTVELPASRAASSRRRSIGLDFVHATMWLPYRRVNRWKSYVFGERANFILSLVAKSALAWQVFAGTLAG